ncbi:hypothetical protein FQN54_000014 [Arachnomyces sp. PD_36]|nr:hypothetical protein FQN54_000014 [Arachnomyces sp. PD_36]
MSQQTTPDGTVTTTPSTLKTLYSTPSSPFERQIGYYRAVRVANQIFVSGTTSVSKTSSPTSPSILHPNDAASQARVAFTESIQAIQALGGRGAESVVRVKMFVAKKDVCGEVGGVFGEFFGKDKGGEMGCAATMIVVQDGFIDGGMLVEVEVDAVVY